jgi:hypothetical protein
MQVLLGAATLFFYFYCCRVVAFGSQDLGFRTSINGHWVLGPVGPSAYIFIESVKGQFCHRTAYLKRLIKTKSNSAYFKRLTETESNSVAERHIRHTNAASDFIYKSSGYPRPSVTVRCPCIVLLNSPYFLFLKNAIA